MAAAAVARAPASARRGARRAGTRRRPAPPRGAPRQATADAGPAKARLARLVAGTGNGTDMESGRRSEVGEVLAELKEANPCAEPARMQLAGTNWRLVYTDSTGNSSGKLGPFVGDVFQEFQTDSLYENVVLVGPLRVGLKARATPLSDTKLEVQFLATSVRVFGIQLVEKELTAKGTWEMQYADEGLRVLIANTGNTFALERVP